MCKNLDGGRSGSRSTARLRGATLRLLDERGPEELTITDVVAAAGVTRPTFYAVFGDLPSAVAEAALFRLEQAFEGATLAADLPAAERGPAMELAYLGILRRLEDHADFFSRILRGSGGYAVQERGVRFVAGRLREDSPLSPALAAGPLVLDAAATALAAAVTWRVLTWLGTAERESAEQLAVELRDLVLHAVVGGLGGTITVPAGTPTEEHPS